MTIVSSKENENIEMTPERLARLNALANMPDSEIDYSEIPPMTEEELARMRPFREVMAELRAQKKQAAAIYSGSL
jgi:ribosomal protein S21